MSLYKDTNLCYKDYIGRGRVTRFLFGPLNLFIYISHWAARVNSQNRLHFGGDYQNWWLTCTLLGAIQLTASRSNMITYLCKKIGTWYLLIWYGFHTWSLQPKKFYMVVTGTQRQSVRFPGLGLKIIQLHDSFIFIMRLPILKRQFLYW